MAKEDTKEFWISNISDKNVSLRDLAYSVPARKHVNLLGKGFNFTIEQLEKSAESGSLKAKGHFIKIRSTEPPTVSIFFVQKEVSKEPRFTTKQPAYSLLKIEQKEFEELNDSNSDAQFIDELTEDFLKKEE